MMIDLLEEQINKEIMIIGDFVLDRYIEVEKFNIDIDNDPFGMEYVCRNRVNSIGGSGILARQCKEFSNKVRCVGIMGKDDVGKELSHIFRDLELSFIEIIHDAKLISPFRERITRVRDLQVVKLIRNGYFNNEISNKNFQSNGFVPYMNSLSRLPDILFLCDFLHGLFTKDIYDWFESKTLENTVCILKARRWKEEYKKIPIDLLCIDAHKDWINEYNPIYKVQQNLLKIGEEIKRHVTILCKINAEGEQGDSQILLCNIGFSEKHGKMKIREQFIIGNNKKRCVGYFSIVTSLVGLLFEKNNPSLERFKEIIEFVSETSFSWEYEITTHRNIAQWQKKQNEIAKKTSEEISNQQLANDLKEATSNLRKNTERIVELKPSLWGFAINLHQLTTWIKNKIYRKHSDKLNQ